MPKIIDISLELSVTVMSGTVQSVFLNKKGDTLLLQILLPKEAANL